MRNPVAMGAIVTEFIQEEVAWRQWSMKRFAAEMQASERLAESIHDGKSNVSELLFHRLSRAFGTSAAVWRNLQKGQNVAK